jgi:hypothetical protein
MYTRQRAVSGAIELAIQGFLLVSVHTRRVHVNGLPSVSRIDTDNAMARSLRFARGDTNFLSEQMIH